MTEATKQFYNKRGQILVKNLKARHFDAYYCETGEEALKKALELIPEGSSVGWGGALSAEQIGLMDAIHAVITEPSTGALQRMRKNGNR